MQIRDLAPQELQQISNYGIVLIYFYDSTNPDYRLIINEIEKIPQEGLYFHAASFDINKDKELAEQFKVESTPNLIVLKGDQILGRETKFMSSEEISEWGHFSTIMGF